MMNPAGSDTDKPIVTELDEPDDESYDGSDCEPEPPVTKKQMIESESKRRSLV
jgi:hypothetical protein